MSPARWAIGAVSAIALLLGARSHESGPADLAIEEHRGVNWVAGPGFKAGALERLQRVHVNRIMQTPFGWQRTHDSPEIRLETQRVYWGERDDLELQARAYRALFETFWAEPWFAGAYFWKWHPAGSRVTGPDFSPQGKPAEAVLGEWYRRPN